VHATLRRLQCEVGKASEVAGLIESEYLPQLREIDGVVSYTLMLAGEDQISSLGVFASESSAQRANELAVAWAKNRLARLAAAPLEASDGEVLLHASFSS